jgi:cell division protein FtsB
MTGVELPATPAQPPGPPPGRPRPASRGGLAWLVVLLLVGAFVTFQVGRQVYTSWSIGQEADRIRQEIGQIEAQNAALRKELDYLTSDAYISAQARALANVGRQGERVLIIPPGAETELPPAQVEPATPGAPLLEQWLDLFFGP